MILPRLRFTLTVLIIVFGGRAASSQSIDTSHIHADRTPDMTRLDQYLDALEANNRFMGSVAVSKDRQIIYTRTVGYMDLAFNIKAGPHTKYRIGSISKTFTAVLVLKAVEEQKLALDQTIARHFPSLENAEQITVAHLLNHRSGIHNFTDDADYLTWHQQPKTESEMIDIITKAGSDFAPGTRSQYSNSNYVLLTYLLEKAFGQSYRQLLAAYITRPLGLNNTYLGGKITPSANESRSYGYAGDGIWEVAAETALSIPLGAGGIVSTPSDLVKFSDALFNGEILASESLAIMKTVEGSFGSGLIQVPFFDKTGYGHTGGIDGFSSVFLHFSEGNVSYALTSNGTNFDNNRISVAALSAVYGQPFDLPVFTTYTVNPEELDQYVGIYAATQIPMTIKVVKENGRLIAQASDQPAFPLEATDKHVFEFDPASIRLTFNPGERTMQLKQGEFLVDFVKQEN